MNQSTFFYSPQPFPFALSLSGRWWLNLQAQWHCWRWRLSVDGAGAAKRALDIVGSLAALVLLGPLFLLIGLFVCLEDGGPALFSQTRVGRHGREFKMYKFRSMRPDAEARLNELLAKNNHAEGVTFKIKNDPRLTRVGRLLRKLSADE